MDALPRDVLSAVLLHLPQRDRMAATRTSRAWASQRSRLWRRLASIRVWSDGDDRVDRVVFAFDDGSAEVYGGAPAHAASARPFVLERDEVLAAVCVRDGRGRVDALCFCARGPRRCRTSPIYGVRGLGRTRVLARADGGAAFGLAVDAVASSADAGDAGFALARVAGLLDRTGAPRRSLRYDDRGFEDAAEPFFDDLVPAVAKLPPLADLPRESPETVALRRWAFNQGLRMGVLLSLRGGSDDEGGDSDDEQLA